LVRTVETTAVIVLRGIEEEAMKGKSNTLKVSVPTDVALYIFNNKREMLANIERRHNVRITLHADDTLLRPHYKVESVRAVVDHRAKDRPAPVKTVDMSDMPEIEASEDIVEEFDAEEEQAGEPEQRQAREPREPREPREGGDNREGGRRRRGRRGGRNRNRNKNRNRGERSEGGNNAQSPSSESSSDAPASIDVAGSPAHDFQDNDPVTGEPRKGWWKRLTE
jgi:ribonuclease E